MAGDAEQPLAPAAAARVVGVKPPVGALEGGRHDVLGGGAVPQERGDVRVEVVGRRAVQRLEGLGARRRASVRAGDRGGDGAHVCTTNERAIRHAGGGGSVGSRDMSTASMRRPSLKCTERITPSRTYPARSATRSDAGLSVSMTRRTRSAPASANAQS